MKFIVEIGDNVESNLDMIQSLNGVSKVVPIDDELKIGTVVATTVAVGRNDKMAVVGKITEILEANRFIVQRITHTGRKSNLTRNMYDIVPLKDFIDLKIRN